MAGSPYDVQLFTLQGEFKGPTSRIAIPEEQIKELESFPNRSEIYRSNRQNERFLEFAAG
jgi:hypothetical protein